MDREVEILNAEINSFLDFAEKMFYFFISTYNRELYTGQQELDRFSLNPFKKPKRNMKSVER